MSDALPLYRFVRNPSPNQPFIFDIDGRTLEFGREDFCLITGFRFGKVNLDPKEEDHSEFRKRVFPKIANLKGEDLLALVNKDVKFNKLDDEDVGILFFSSVLRSTTRGSSNSKSVHTRVQTEVRHEIVRYFGVDEDDMQVRGFVIAKNLSKPQEQTGPSDVDHLDKVVVDKEEVHVRVVDKEDVLEEFTKQLKTGPYDVDHLDKVTELINDIFDTPSICPDSVQDAFISELMDVDQPSLVKNVLDDVHIDSVVKDADESDVKTVYVRNFPDLTRSPTAPKRTMSVPEGVMALFRDKNRMEMSWTFLWVEDGHLVQMDFWEKLVGRSHTKRGWLSIDHLDIWIEYLWQFRDPNDDWAMASPYLSDMLLRFEYPLYYADGVKYGVLWFANNVEKVYFPINKKDFSLGTEALQHYFWFVNHVDLPFDGVLGVSMGQWGSCQRVGNIGGKEKLVEVVG
ncbi:ulp1 protease family, C-terminal catalytic domain-containing protein [Tanacetum coccineum]